ncbi:hypothetical protein QEV83_05745 [Methylocapsa sp. D3K7]|uniref:hypothetical protein n=1 Tax=Methylocapsa sp. D3K7 TaxID=3041435 RepID=UPI00244E9291|nr:hypothetical protein [Methylocapsa sp. D3K7]WGJ15761.1 hypothetical protein QEV83_05745 [Methylocapsa sp. D3K7]
MIAQFYIKDGVGFATKEDAALLARHGDISRIELKIVSKEELDRLMNNGDGHVVGLRPAGASLH